MCLLVECHNTCDCANGLSVQKEMMEIIDGVLVPVAFNIKNNRHGDSFIRYTSVYHYSW